MTRVRTSLNAGLVIGGRYELVGFLGQGGYGEVWKAIQSSTGQHVAVKILHHDVAVDPSMTERLVARFVRELQVVARLNHPGIVRLIDSGQLQDARLFIVLEFVDGDDLKQVLAREGSLSLSETLRLMTQVLEALSAAHEVGVIHRDLKPENIMISSAGGRRTARVLDFGIAALTDKARDPDYRDLTEDRQYLGTPAFMAPELLRDAIVTRGTDVYAWGLLVIQCLTGEQVVSAPHAVSVMLEQLKPDPIALPPVLRDHPLREVIERTVAKDPEQRFPDAASVLDALERAQLTSWPELEPVRPAPPPEPAPEPEMPAGDSTILQRYPAPPHPVEEPEEHVEPRTEILDVVFFEGFEEPPTRDHPIVEPAAVEEAPAYQPRPTILDPAPPAFSGVAPVVDPAPPPEPSQHLKRRVGIGLLVVGALLVLLTVLLIRGGSESTSETEAAPSGPSSPPERDAVALPGGGAIDRLEVTVAGYARCVAAGACEPIDTASCWGHPELFNDAERADHPVNCVTWRQADAWCQWAGGALPDAEAWSRAARGEEARAWPWGDTPPADAAEFVGNVADRAFAARFGEKHPAVPDYDDGHAGTAPVGRFPAGAGASGALDLGGNVAEWTAQRAGEGRRVARGGSFVSAAAGLRVDAGVALPEGHADASVGFRCAWP